MNSVWEVLNSLESPRLRIVETGTFYTVEIASWVSRHPESELISVDLNFADQMKKHAELEKLGIAKYCRFLTQDHTRYLNDRTWADVVFLRPENLFAGMEDFAHAVSTGAKIIVIPDYQTRAAWAVKRAQEIGWEFIPSDHMNILRRKP